MGSKPPPRSISGRRYSASGEASRRDELERLKSATPIERMALALALGRRRRQLLELRRNAKPDGD
jgi:hypothetical protein